MKKIAAAVLFVVLTLQAASSYAVGQPGFGIRNRQAAGMRMGMINSINNTQRIAYRSIIRAANNIQMAKAVFGSIANGRLLFKKAKEYYSRANKLYSKQQYINSAHYAAASMCLSSSILHIYKAQSPVKLPAEPK